MSSVWRRFTCAAIVCWQLWRVLARKEPAITEILRIQLTDYNRSMAQQGTHDTGEKGGGCMLRSQLMRTGRQGITREELEPLLAGTPGQDISLLGQLLCWDWGSLANLQTCIMFFVVTYWIFNLTIETLLENHMVQQGHKCQEHQFSAEHPKNTFYTEYIASYMINEVRQKKTGNKDWNLDRMNGQRNYSTMSQVPWVSPVIDGR
ncbi:hypothetical protein FOXYSP1_07406 [Fusarium oxysporum f. sp. phaseoli]